MRWREILTGALITLFVTIAAGIIVFYVTFQKAPAGEKLVYEVGKPFTFDSQKTKDSFQNIQVANIGEQAAHDVVVVVRFSGPVRVLDHSIGFSSGVADQLTGDQL